MEPNTTIQEPRNFRLGLIVRDDMTGLGIQTHAYHKWLKPDKTILIDLSPLNGNKQNGWYPNADLHIKGIPNLEQVHAMLKDIDVLFTAETVYNLELYKIAKMYGVRTISVENPEFFDGFKYPQFDIPDLIILPSIWMEHEVREFAESRGSKVVQIHHPVDRDEFPFRLRECSKTVHLAGKPAAYDRNGTWLYMQACPNGTVTTQDVDFANRIRQRYRHSNVVTNIPNPIDIYSYGDILVLPRRYGGNCLPLNEALSTGMPVIMPDISPNYNILPKNWLVPAVKTDSFEPRGKVDIYSCDTNILAERIAWVQANIQSQSEIANQIANTISWETLLPKYLEAIESVL